METTGKNTAFKVSTLDIGYIVQKKAVRIARDIQFELSPGELAAIVGVNGIGKSTLLRTLGSVQPRISGDIKIHSKPLEKYNATELARVLSVVLTEPIASKNLTVRELVGLGRQPYTNWIGAISEGDKSAIEDAIRMVSLETLQAKKCYELSDGQLQKVMIARALAQDTSIVLLDEPTTHLDLFHKVQILKLLQRIAHERKKIILYTTHEIELAIQLCDKILIMDEGRNSFGGPCELIEKKHFESLFPPDSIVFDSKTGSFKVKRD